MDALVGDWLTKLANDDVLNKRFIKTDLYAKSSKMASGIKGSVPIDSGDWSNLRANLFENNRVIKFNGKFREAYPYSNLGKVG